MYNGSNKEFNEMIGAENAIYFVLHRNHAAEERCAETFQSNEVYDRQGYIDIFQAT